MIFCKAFRPVLFVASFAVAELFTLSAASSNASSSGSGCPLDPYPTALQLRDAQRLMRDKPPSTIFNPLRDSQYAARYGSHSYYKDQDNVTWHYSATNLDRGVVGCVRKAYRLYPKDRAGKEEVTLVKFSDVNLGEALSRVSFKNEVDVLRDLGRLVGSSYSLFNGVSHGRDLWNSAETRCDWSKSSDRCPIGTEAVFLQTFCPGKKIKDYPEAQVTRDLDLIVARAREAVATFHGKGWVHGDLHLNNAILESNGNTPPDYKVHMIDFGFARRLVKGDDVETNGKRDLRPLRDWPMWLAPGSQLGLTLGDSLQYTQGRDGLRTLVIEQEGPSLHSSALPSIPSAHYFYLTCCLLASYIRA